MQQNNAIYNLLSPNAFLQNSNGAYPIKNVYNGNVAVANNTQLVAGVTGKRIMVVGGFAYSNGAFTQLTFKSATGGTNKRGLAVPANTVAQPNVPLCPNGILDMFETETGQGLFVDNSAVIALISINYIEYIP